MVLRESYLYDAKPHKAALLYASRALAWGAASAAGTKAKIETPTITNIIPLGLFDYTLSTELSSNTLLPILGRLVLLLTPGTPETLTEQYPAMVVLLGKGS